ncbi:MAG TPA: SAM-dependent methyltransferase [Gemmatimonadales bacterium]|nr:SAM-dependent methyltransferase [Gemmatimonadales bacterium]
MTGAHPSPARRPTLVRLGSCRHPLPGASLSDTTDTIQHVSDTARWVALYRAMESDRPDALFRDPYARRLAGERAERILDRLPKGRAWAWPMIVRTAVMDEVILGAIAKDGVDTVLNLAAGLDTRPYRLSLPRTLRWIEVDFPDVIAYKEAQLATERPVAALERLGLDLTDVAGRRRLFAQIGAAARQVLVVSEGLLIYLTPEQVAALARDLAAPATFRWWLLDLASPRLIQMMAKNWGPALAAGNAPFQFAPAEGTRFFPPHGWEEAEFRSMWEEANRLHRADVPFAWLWRVLTWFSSAARREEMRRMSGIVLLRRP